MIFTTPDLLKGKTATQSSDGQGANSAAALATDGVKTCMWQQSGNHLSQTTESNNPWWQGDMGAS